jgi:phosphatidylglycerophosphate synthase
MLFQCVAIGLELGSRTWPELSIGLFSIHQVAIGVVWLAVISTIWSGLEYVLAARPLLSQDS